MGCPYIRNRNERFCSPRGGWITVTTDGQTVCPECGSTDIGVKWNECKCKSCGYVLCGPIPKC